MPETIAQGIVHEIPHDLQQILISNSDLREKWNALTPIMRNEWICWVTFVKKAETRKEHIRRFSADILSGKRRPCCWPGCPHRRPNVQKWFEKAK